MKLSAFDFELPKKLVAQEPASPRDRSRLLILDRKTEDIEHRLFKDIGDYLRAGDLLVLNNSKVMPARLYGTKPETGGKIEVFLLREIEAGKWQCLLGGKKLQAGMKLELSKRLDCEVISNNEDGTWLVAFSLTGAIFKKEIDKIGNLPLPPYIKRETISSSDKIRYQTIYADKGKTGSVAAPTAGLHFTARLMKQLEKKGVEFAYVTLHVGLGTFVSVKTEDIEEHKMHEEFYEVDKATVAKIVKAKRDGRRVIAVGTTSTRVLESAFLSIQNSKFKIQNFSSWTSIFIYPGYEFKVVDAMITNFHVPKSTLLMLVSAFAGNVGDKDGLKKIRNAYESAIENQYRFFSFGDAMLIK